MNRIGAVLSTVFVGLAIGFGSGPAIGDDAALREEAAAAMKRAARFYRERVATRGGYVYHYSPDLSERWGEGRATRDQIWVQPPGTPTVGMAYLEAYNATGDRYYLDAATEAAEALIYGQLRSGGWTNLVDFDPNSRRTAAYRNGKGRGKDNSTLDDGITQAAIQFLARADAAHDFEHEGIHEAAQVALDALLAAQFPNGGFPQVWTGPVPERPVVSARFPQHDWRTEGRIKNYWDMYTLNDGLAGDVAAALIDTHRIYKDPKYKAALARLGDFLLRAQLPDPQPAWAQQYNVAMEPIWARKFEPAAVAGHESQDVLDALLTIYEHTGDEKYLEPIPRAHEYLTRSRLPDGRLARYYELETNRPLYMLRRGDDYTLTYDDADLPGHYGWKWESRLDEIAARYRELKRGGPPADQEDQEKTTRPVPDEATVRRIIDALDGQGRWVSTYRGERLVGQAKFATGAPYIASEVFSRRLTTLADYLAGTRPTSPR